MWTGATRTKRPHPSPLPSFHFGLVYGEKTTARKLEIYIPPFLHMLMMTTLLPPLTTTTNRDCV